MPRALLIGAALACASLLAFLIASGGAGGEPVDVSRDAAREESAELEENAVPVDVHELTSRAEAEDRSAPAPAAPRESASRSAQIRLRVVARGTDVGLHEYRLALIPAGSKGPFAPGDGHGWGMTDAEGHLALEVPDATVHLEAHGRTPAPPATEEVFPRTVRLMTLTPEDLAKDMVHVIEVDVGPRVVLRGVIPRDIAATDLRFELRGTISFLSSQAGGNGGFARGFRDANGRVNAIFPPLTNSTLESSFSLRVWSTDGLWGLAKVENRKLTNEMEIFVDEFLEPRGRFEVLVEILGEDPAPRPATELARKLRWTVRGGDSEREGRTQLTMTGSATRYPEPATEYVGRTAGRVVRFGDLPEGATIEFESPTPGTAWSTAYELVEAPTRIVTSRDEEPEWAVLRLRRR